MHIHEQAYFSMMLDGGYREESGRRSIDYDPLTIAYHPPGTAHIDEIGPDGARFLMVEADDGMVRGSQAPASLRSGYPKKLPRRASWMALSLLRDHDRPTFESITLELLGSVVDDPVPSRGVPSWLVSVLDRVRDEFIAPPTTRALAESAGVHPVHLARVVRRETGMTIAEILRGRRIEHAASLLGGHETLASIAIRSGFCDQAHFTRSFRAWTGMTPGEMRRLIRM